MKAAKVLAAALLAAATPVTAQIAPVAPGTSETIPEKDRSRPQDMPKDREPGGGAQEDGVTTGRSLSDRLHEQGGVIKPPKGIDPEMVEPPPPTHSPMPVIPPPGTPAGPPGPVPK
jgi:hypothetical protein